MLSLLFRSSWLRIRSFESRLQAAVDVSTICGSGWVPKSRLKAGLKTSLERNNPRMTEGQNEATGNRLHLTKLVEDWQRLESKVRRGGGPDKGRVVSFKY